MRGWAIGLVCTVLVGLALAIAAVVAVTSSGADTALVDLEAGTCFELPDSVDSGTIESVVTIDCTQPHLAEVVAVGELGTEGRDYPDDDVLFGEVDQACRAVSPVTSDVYGLLPIAPTRDLWESFDGRYLCVAIPFGGEPTGGSILTG
ncbi:MAG: septum formation family protein [Ilumatobacteraceae bacterium]